MVVATMKKISSSIKAFEAFAVRNSYESWNDSSEAVSSGFNSVGCVSSESDKGVTQ